MSKQPLASSAEISSAEEKQLRKCTTAETLENTFLNGDNFKDYFVSVEIMTAVTDVVRAGGANVSLQFSIV